MILLFLVELLSTEGGNNIDTSSLAFLMIIVVQQNPYYKTLEGLYVLI